MKVDPPALPMLPICPLSVAAKLLGETAPAKKWQATDVLSMKEGLGTCMQNCTFISRQTGGHNDNDNSEPVPR